MKIVVFLNALHQRKYVEIVRDAFSSLEDVVVEPAEAGLEEQGDGSGANVRKRRWLPSRRAMLKVLPFSGDVAAFLRTRVRPVARDIRRDYLKPLSQAARRATEDKPVARRILRIPYRFVLGVWHFSPIGFVLGIFRSITGYYRQHSYVYALASDRHWRNYIETRVFARKPDFVILLEDNVQGLTGMVAQRASELAIPFAILPDYIPNPAEPARYYLGDPTHSADTVAGRIVQYLAPRWALRYDGRRLLRLPPPQIFARWLRKQPSPQPWILNAGLSEAILLESNASLDHYRQLGFLEQKLKVIGGAVEDRIHAVHANRSVRRAELFARYGFDPSRPLIICGFPPDQYSASTEGFEYESFEDLCRGWFEVLAVAARDANVLVVRHPRLRQELLQPYLGADIRLADVGLESVLPLADLYIACISTTIRWALALGIPVVNYDCYRYAYGDFSRAGGIREVDSLAEFRSAIGGALASGGLDEFTAGAREDAGHWGLVDGGFNLRLRETISGISAAYKGVATPTHAQSYRLRKWP